MEKLGCKVGTSNLIITPNLRLTVKAEDIAYVNGSVAEEDKPWLSISIIRIQYFGVSFLIVVFASNRFRRISRRIQHSMGAVTHVVSEVANGYREVKIFGGQQQVEDRFLRAS